MSSEIRIIIADDHPIVRQGLVALLDDQEDMNVVAELNNGREAIAEYRELQPDIAILDLRMPQIGGVEAIQTIRAEFPTACIIMFTIYDTDEDIYRGLQAGAKSYLLKDTPCEKILEIIRTVHGGKRYIPTGVSLKLAERLERPNLTKRETEVLQQIAYGRNNQEIGDILTISEATVKFHINNIFAKLDVSDRTQAVIEALKRGLTQLETQNE
ncbi:response regulator transcription factor [Pleurocapsales cyanobacterium LEGE 10410]|nr:response regulator transcription factor [Pleurocapsales cyanobacterium LEGE 10410]